MADHFNIKHQPSTVHAGLLTIGIIGILAIAFPFIAASFGNSWFRIMDMTLLYVMLALGLNIVVGFAGLLDLGYIAFYALGAIPQPYWPHRNVPSCCNRLSIPIPRWGMDCFEYVVPGLQKMGFIYRSGSSCRWPLFWRGFSVHCWVRRR